MPQFFPSLIPRLLLLAVVALALPLSARATPRITEFMAANDSGLADEDGAFSDWIEIQNTGAQPISLAGYYLTDDKTQLTRWQFPAVTLNAGAYLVVFASGKDRTNPAATLHTDFELAAAGEYLALIAPDGRTVVSEFAPSYPEQFDNESYGWIDPPALTFFSTPTPGAANGAGRRAGPTFGAALRNPAQPVTGPLVVTALLRPTNAPVARVTLYYRLMFGAETSLAMTDDGLGGDSFAGDGVWSAIIPATAFVPGEMTRWRFLAADSGNVETKEPAFRSATDSHQYFGTVTHDPATQTLLSVLHWFTSNPGGAGTAAGSRGALYYDGEFYDNVLFNLHGQSSSGFPKKSYNIDFNRTQRFRWSPDAPRVADIDLLTNWADKSKVRHVLGYEVMRQSGVAAHFAFTVRVEQNGNFFSTADFVEDADEIYLERAGLNPEGALYKVYANVLNKDSGNTGTSGVEKKTRRSENNADLQALIDGLDLTGTALTNYLYDNIDIPKCVNMLAANSVIRNIDMHSKNWYIYRDTGRSNEWALLPWDLDLSHGRVWNTTNTYFDNAIYLDGFVVNGTSIRLVSQLFGQAPTRAMLMRRIRTLTDRFLQAPPTAGTPESALYYERRLNEQSALIDPPGISPSDAARDFQKWGSWLQRGTVVPSTNTDPAVETMAEAIQRWKSEYLPGRRNFIYNTQIVGKGGEIPLPQRSGATEPVINFGTIDFSPASGNQDQEYIELLNPNTIAVDISDWRLTGAIEHTFPGGTVIPANRALYLCPDAAAFRARTASPRGGEGRLVQGGYRGHLSNLGETLQLIDSSGTLNNSTTYQGQPSAVQRYLVISEVMFQPPGDGLAEYIELINVSNSETLDLTGVRFTEGVSFAFTGSAITSLAPGARVLVVRDTAAFQAAHGAGHPVAGVFADGSALGNGGESIKLEDPTNGTIQEFTYDDATPWPGGTDGAGYSLVLIAPQTNPDSSLAGNWRSSAAVGGTPGGNDLLALPADPTVDANANGIVDLIDYALGSDGGRGSIAPHFARQSGVSGTAGSLLFVYPIQLGADRAEIRVFVSSDLTSWRDGMADLEIVSNEHLGDGRALLSWRVKSPLAEEPRLFMRLRITPR